MNKKFVIKNTVLILFMLLGVSCAKEDNDLNRNIQIYDILPSYFMMHGETGFIDENCFDGRGKIINSKEQLDNDLSVDFLDKYPKYKEVDFSKYSIILNYSTLTYKAFSKRVYVRLKTDKLPNYIELNTYYTLENIPFETFQYELFGIVVDKLEDDLKVDFVTTMRLKMDRGF